MAKGIKCFRFSEYAGLDAKERLSLLTVAAGLRRAALLLETQKPSLASLKDTLINMGFVAFFSKPPSVDHSASDSHYGPEIRAVLKRWLGQEKERGLWVCNRPEHRDLIRMPGINLPLFLGYPECCVVRDTESKKQVHDEFVAAIVRVAGGDPREVDRHMREKTTVEVVAYRSDNIDLTHKVFPFVLHIACESCLSAAESPSAALNREYQSFIRDLDPIFHEVLLRMEELDWMASKAEDQEERDRLFAESESVYSNALS